ncbi:hypothetical protein Tco_0334319, partial [Tanacetum coccineum]
TLFAQQADQELLQTVQNYSMHGMGKTVNELHDMLHEQTRPKQNAPALHVIRAGKFQKKKNKQKPRFRARGQNQRKGKSVTPPKSGSSGMVTMGCYFKVQQSRYRKRPKMDV